jgi:hypothetical protein
MHPVAKCALPLAPDRSLVCLKWSICVPQAKGVTAMFEYVKPAFLVFLIVIVPGVVGGILAANRGRRVVGWCLLCALFFPLLLYIYFAKPLCEVEGEFRKCPDCGEFFKWDEPVCTFCRSAPVEIKHDAG